MKKKDIKRILKQIKTLSTSLKVAQEKISDLEKIGAIAADMRRRVERLEELDYQRNDTLNKIYRARYTGQ